MGRGTLFVFVVAAIEAPVRRLPFEIGVAELSVQEIGMSLPLARLVNSPLQVLRRFRQFLDARRRRGAEIGDGDAGTLK